MKHLASAESAYFMSFRQDFAAGCVGAALVVAVYNNLKSTSSIEREMKFLALPYKLLWRGGVPTTTKRVKKRFWQVFVCSFPCKVSSAEMLANLRIAISCISISDLFINEEILS